MIKCNVQKLKIKKKKRKEKHTSSHVNPHNIYTKPNPVFFTYTFSPMLCYQLMAILVFIISITALNPPKGVSKIHDH
jgi:hypothetical protein